MMRAKPFLVALLFLSAALLLSAVLYVALSPGANPPAATAFDREALMAARTGEMRKLKIVRVPAEMPNVGLLDMDGNDRSLAEFRGKYVVLNFWATWCAPCRREMPSLEALQKDMGSDRFRVVLVAANRNPVPAIRMFFDEAGIDTLETLRDPSGSLTSLIGVFSLPMTLILDPEGREIARLQGDTDWHGEAAVGFLKALVGTAGG